MWLVLVGFVLFALTFDRVSVHDDGIVYFDFVRKLFGTDVAAQAYQFGSAYWTAPFYLVSQLVAARGELDHYHAGEVATAVASAAAAILALYLGWRILRELDLPRGPGLLLLTLFGTPLFYYATIEPAYKHAADALYATAAAWFLLLASKEPKRRYLAAAGACLGLMLATRYANVAIPVGVVVMFAWTRAWRSLGWVLAVTVASAALLYAVPVVRGIPFETPSGTLAAPALGSDIPLPHAPAPVRLAAGASFSVPGANSVDIDPRVPVWMLFTLHRGLFLWTPLTAFATVGFVLLLRRDRRHRAYLAGLLVSATALLLIHIAWSPYWDGGVSFSARFLTALFPFFLIGAAAFVRRTRWIGMAVLTACTIWSVWLGLVMLNGYDNQTSRDGIDAIVANYYGPGDGLDAFSHEIRVRAQDRWSAIWRSVS
jgi:hypothetical protein